MARIDQKGSISFRTIALVAPLLVALAAGGYVFFGRAPDEKPAPPPDRASPAPAPPAGPTVEQKRALAMAAPNYDVLEPKDAPLYLDDPTLGLQPGPLRKVHSWKKAADIDVFDVHFQTDAHGFRKQPGIQAAKSQGTLFFGAAFTFGEGVNDAETYPAVLEKLSNGAFKGWNLGVNAWGPQHMLRFLEESRETRILDGKRPKLAVYLAIAPDVARVSGREPVKGPRYTLDGGALKYQPAGAAPSTPLTPEAERALFVEVVAQSKALFEKRYGGRFVTILWFRDEPPEPVIAALKAKGITAIRIEEIIPDYRANQSRYELFDNHPTAAAHAAIAQFLLQHL